MSDISNYGQFYDQITYWLKPDCYIYKMSAVNYNRYYPSLFDETKIPPIPMHTSLGIKVS